MAHLAVLKTGPHTPLILPRRNLSPQLCRRSRVRRGREQCDIFSLLQLAHIDGCNNVSFLFFSCEFYRVIEILTSHRTFINNSGHVAPLNSQSQKMNYLLQFFYPNPRRSRAIFTSYLLSTMGRLPERLDRSKVDRTLGSCKVSADR